MPLPIALELAGLLGPGLLSSLFGGNHGYPSYKPQDVLRLQSQLYGGLLNGAGGQAMLNQGNIAGNIFGGQLRSNLAATGLDQSGIGALVNAGSGSFSALNRQNVMGDLSNQAWGNVWNLLGGQANRAQFGAQNPSGLGAVGGSISASAWPLLLAMFSKQNPGGLGTNVDSNQNVPQARSPWYA